MTVIFVDGPDGVGKTGYSQHIAAELGWPRFEMRPVDDLSCIQSKSRVFNAFIEDLDAQGIDAVIDRGSTSSIVYSRVFDRPKPEFAWETLEEVAPIIVYLRCDPSELIARYEDELYDAEVMGDIAAEYDDVMDRVQSTTPAQVHTIDTTAGVLRKLDGILSEATGVA